MKFTEKNKIAGLSTTLLQKRLQYRREIFEKTYFVEHLQKSSFDKISSEKARKEIFLSSSENHLEFIYIIMIEVHSMK